MAHKSVEGGRGQPNHACDCLKTHQRPNATAPTNTCSALASPSQSRRSPVVTARTASTTTSRRAPRWTSSRTRASCGCGARARGTYVHADEDAWGVSLRPLGASPSLTAVWRAQYWPVAANVGYLLLQGAAYGRYLAVSPSPQETPPGHRGVRAVQRDYSTPNLEHPFIWLPHRVGGGRNHVRLSNYGRHLRANGRHRYWNNVVTVELPNNGNLSTMMHWTVEAIPRSPVPLPLPPPISPPPPVSVLRGLMFRRRTDPGMHPHSSRRIRYLRLHNWNSILDQDRNDCPEFDFYDNSVFNLRTEVALRLDEDDRNINIFGITLCVQAGLYAEPIPLITNLPRNADRMDIIVFTTGSPIAASLVYPQFDVPEP